MFTAEMNPHLLLLCIVCIWFAPLLPLSHRSDITAAEAFHLKLPMLILPPEMKTVSGRFYQLWNLLAT